jgi:hypothetical protein
LHGTPARSAANENQLGCLWHSLQKFTFMCLVVAASNRLSTYFSHVVLLVPCGYLSFLDWFFGSWCPRSSWPLCSVHLFGWGLRAQQSFLLLIWLACVWVVWNERNHHLFRNAASLVHHLLYKIKMFSFSWLKTTNVTTVSNYYI